MDGFNSTVGCIMNRLGLKTFLSELQTRLLTYKNKKKILKTESQDVLKLGLKS